MIPNQLGALLLRPGKEERAGRGGCRGQIFAPRATGRGLWGRDLFGGRGRGGLKWRRRWASRPAGAMSSVRPQFSIDDAFELTLEDAGPGPESSGVARFGPLHFERRAWFEVTDEDKQSRLRYQVNGSARLTLLSGIGRDPTPGAGEVQLRNLCLETPVERKTVP